MNCCNMVLPSTPVFNVICTHIMAILVNLLHKYYGVRSLIQTKFNRT